MMFGYELKRSVTLPYSSGILFPLLDTFVPMGAPMASKLKVLLFLNRSPLCTNTEPQNPREIGSNAPIWLKRKNMDQEQYIHEAWF